MANAPPLPSSSADEIPNIKHLPGWWYQWELCDELAPPIFDEDMEDFVERPIEFLPTQWTFLPEV